MVWCLMMLWACGGEPAATPAPGAAAEVASPAAKPRMGQRKDIDIAGFAEAQAAGAQIVDVRTQAEFEGGHVPGALLVPLDEFGAQNPAIAGLDAARPVYLICQSGGRSSMAADRLAAAGYTAVNVKGGTAAWKNAGHPLE